MWENDMFNRGWFLVATLILAVLVPYHLSGDQSWGSLTSWWSSLFRGADDVYGHEVGQHDPEGFNWESRRENPPTRPIPTASGTPLPAHNHRLPATPRRPARSTRANCMRPSTSYEQRQTTVAPTPWTPRNATVASGPGPNAASGMQPHLCGPKCRDLTEIIRFDVAPGWVINNWGRVSTRLSELDLEGLRVSVVTGTSASDLVGSLTYYFDRRQSLQRITYRGNSGDPMQLVKLLSDNFHLRAEPWLGAGFYIAHENPQKILSALRIKHAPIIRSDNVNERYDVEFELNRPGSDRELSKYFQSLLSSDRRSKTWTPESDPIARPASANALD